jgi:hypothetical protein
MLSDEYILNDKGEPVRESNIYTWARWFEMSWPTRRVAYEKFGRYTVSTVFLGLNHNFNDNGPPILWESMAFQGDCEEVDCDRCTGGREQAEAMHVAMVERIKSMERF